MNHSSTENQTNSPWRFIAEEAKKGMAMRRRLLVPGASPMLGAVGNRKPPVPFFFSPWSHVSTPLFGRPSTFHLTTFAPPPLSLFCSCLRVNISSNSSLVFRLDSGCLSKSFNASSFVLRKRSSSSARFFPVFQASPLVAWPHVHELLALLSFILSCGLYVELAEYAARAIRGF